MNEQPKLGRVNFPSRTCCGTGIICGRVARTPDGGFDTATAKQVAITVRARTRIEPMTRLDSETSR